MEISLTTMMKINPEIEKFAKVFVFLDLCLIIYCLIFQDIYWLINTQVAFISSLLVSIASFLSYKRSVEKRLKSMDLQEKSNIENQDVIDKIDDPYDLYSEYEEIPEEELDTQKIKEIINEEKTKIKKNSFKNMFISFGGLSLYRVFAYAFLIIGFLSLNNHNKLIPIAFLAGLAIVPIGVLLSKLKK